MQAWMRHLETVRWFGGKGAGAHITALTPLGWYTPTGRCANCGAVLTTNADNASGSVVASTT